MIEILDTLAWPATVLLLAFGFHAQLSALLRRVSGVGYDGFSVRFDRLIGPAERALPADDDPADHDKDAYAAHENRARRLRRLAEQAPRAAILEAWGDLVDALDAHPRPGVRGSVGGGGDVTAVGDDALHALSDIRDGALAADDREVSHEAAARYVSVACRARDRIEKGRS
ncbi:MAG: hypothetical protein WBL23_00190 [Salinisphaera sp.]|uniref:hypothetical protein n=1 Tax=Salinisphaera sp. TaxID=1914330 RepID=UPI003C7A2AC0